MVRRLAVLSVVVVGLCVSAQAQYLVVTGNGVALPPGLNVGFRLGATEFPNAPVGGSSQSQFVARNIGDASLTISGVAIVGTNSADFSASAAQSTVPPGGSTVITATFAPLTEGDSKVATLRVVSNATNESIYAFAITGSTTALPDGPKSISLGAIEGKVATAKQNKTGITFKMQALAANALTTPTTELAADIWLSDFPYLAEGNATELLGTVLVKAIKGAKNGVPKTKKFKASMNAIGYAPRAYMIATFHNNYIPGDDKYYDNHVVVPLVVK